MLVVTTEQIHGWDVERVCGEVFGLSLRARVVPGADGEQTLAESRTEVISRMLEHARAKGGNAVVGLRFDAAELGDGSTELCAYGTAIVAIPMDQLARQTATALGYGQPGGAPENAESPTPLHDPNQQYAPQQYAQHQQYAQQYQQPHYEPNLQYQPHPGQWQNLQQPGHQMYPHQGYETKRGRL